MKLFSRNDVIALEEKAQRRGVAMETLMENAGCALAAEICAGLSDTVGKRAVILCGKGNNGGDGFVCAAKLLEKGMKPAAVLCMGKPAAKLAKAAFDRMPDGIEILELEADKEKIYEYLKDCAVIAECVFGFGFQGELPKNISELFLNANNSPALRIACDIPGGADCDTAKIGKNTFRAHITVSFTCKKPVHASYPAKEYCGEVKICPVGVPETELSAYETLGEEPSAEEMAALLPKREAQSNKGTYGRLLMVCGSYGMAGACIMAAQGALRSGAGLLEIAVDERIYPILAPAIPEAVFTPLPLERKEETEKLLIQALSRASACLTGCGLGSASEICCPTVFSNCMVPLIIDADGLNFLSRYPEYRKKIKAPCMLTPHPGEMSRLCGMTVGEIQGDRLNIALSEAKSRSCVLVLKGAATVTADSSGRYAVNPTGNPGMAKGGSGDVLAGIAGSFAAQGMELFDAARASVYFHGAAGDLCAAEMSRMTMLPTDIPRALSHILP